MARKKETAVAEAAGEPKPRAEVDRAVVFSLGDQLYGLPIASVQEIQQIVEFTAVPDDAPALVGMLDLRGRILPAIDLRVLVGMERRSYDLDTPMIVCRTKERLVALVVDAVHDVVSLPSGCIQEPSHLYSLADRMLGVCRLERGLVLLLDPDTIVPETTLALVSELEGGELA